MSAPEKIARGYSFGEALWNLVQGLEQLRSHASTLSNAYEHAAGTFNSAPVDVPGGLKLPPLPSSSRGLPTEQQRAQFQKDLAVLVEKRPKACPTWCLPEGQLPSPPVINPTTLEGNVLSSPDGRVVSKPTSPTSVRHASDKVIPQSVVHQHDERKQFLQSNGPRAIEGKKVSLHFEVGQEPQSDNVLLSSEAKLQPEALPIQGTDSMMAADSMLPCSQDSLAASQPSIHEVDNILLRRIWKEEAQRSDTDPNTLFQLKAFRNNQKTVRPIALQGRRMSTGESSDVLDTLAMQHDKRSPCILHPMSPIRMLWCFLTMVMIAYDVLFIPMEAFPMPRLQVFFYAEWVITIFWTVDIAVTFRTGYMSGTKVEMQASLIAKNYCKSWFVPDVLIVCMDWAGRLLTAVIQGARPGSVSRIARVFRARGLIRAVRLLRVSRLQGLASALEDQVNSATISLIFALIKMTTLLVLLLHFLTCSWFLLGDNTENGWVGYPEIPECGLQPATDGREPMPEDESRALFELMEWYFYSARWVGAQVNGRVDQDARRNMAEMAFTTVLSVVGPMLAMSVFVSRITATMMELNTMAQSRRATRLRLNQYLADHQVSATLTARMKAHLRDRKDFNVEMEAEKFVLSVLPKQLQTDLMYEIRAPTMFAHRLFDAINKYNPPAIKHVTMQAMMPLLTHQDETIFETGDACNRMLFAYRGRFLYSQNDKDTHQECVQRKLDSEETGRKNMKKGNGSDVADGCDNGAQEIGHGVWISEAAIWLEWQNQGMLTALNDGMFFSLEVDSFNLVVKRYINVLTIVIAYAVLFESSLQSQKGHLSDIVDMECECYFMRNRRGKRAMFDQVKREIFGSR